MQEKRYFFISKMVNKELLHQDINAMYSTIHTGIVRTRGQKPPDSYGIHLGLCASDTSTLSRKDHQRAVQAMTNRIIGLSEIEPHQVILDAGCGTGSVAFRTAALHPTCQVVAINIVPSQLLYAQDIRMNKQIPPSSTQFCMADYTVMPFGESSFHRAIFADSISHSPDLAGTLEQTRRVLKSEGRVVVTDYFCFAEQDDPEVQQFKEDWLGPGIVSIETFEDIASSVGFTHIAVEDLTSQVFPSAVFLQNKRLPQLSEGQPADTSIISGGQLLTKLMEDQKIGYFSIVAQS